LSGKVMFLYKAISLTTRLAFNPDTNGDLSCKIWVEVLFRAIL